MKLLVTGGAGFIGSHLVDRLLSQGDEVVLLDNFDPFYSPEVKQANIEAHLSDPACRLVRTDIRDLAVLDSSLDGGFDAIVHLAGRAGVRPSLEDPRGYQETNVQGTQNLLELARSWGTPQFVFASSSSVYGVNPNVPWSEDDHVLLPISPYASTKVSGELMGHVYAHLYGIRFIALRFFTVYGPRQRPDLAIHKFARRMLRGDPVPVYGDGSSRRDYTYIDDVVDGICAAIRYDRAAYEVINLGNNRTVGLLEMVRAIEDVLGVRADLEWLPNQPGDVPQTWASVAKAERLLGYRPATDFREGLSRFAAWLRADPEAARTSDQRST